MPKTSEKNVEAPVKRIPDGGRCHEENGGHCFSI